MNVTRANDRFVFQEKQKPQVMNDNNLTQNSFFHMI